MSSTLRTLPGRFQPIEAINSRPLRAKLVDTLTSIHGLLGDIRKDEIDPYTSKLVDRYFAYLSDSCLSTKTINKRGVWILNFGRRVQSHLLSLRYQRVQKVRYDEADLQTRVKALTESVVAYRLSHKTQIGSDRDLHNLLAEIEELARFAPPSEAMDRAYERMVEDIDTLASILDHLRIIGDASMEDEFALIGRLAVIQYQITEYLIRSPLIQ